MIVNSITLMRPKQWIKNLLIVAPIIFSLQYNSHEAWINVLLALLCFILTSTSVYIINDLKDVKEDILHPHKSRRAIASGDVPPAFAMVFAAVALALALVISYKFLPGQSMEMLVYYFILQNAYTFILKNIAIIDVSTTAIGLVLRVMLGSFAVEVEASLWIILTTFMLGLFIGFGKRHYEMMIDEIKGKKPALKQYTKYMLESLISISCALSVVTYLLYSLEKAAFLKLESFPYTTLLVLVGMLRFLQLVFNNDKYEEPETLVLKDPALVVISLTWFATTIYLLGMDYNQIL